MGRLCGWAGGWAGGWGGGRVTIQILMPLCGPILQDELTRFSVELKFQDRAECGNNMDL